MFAFAIVVSTSVFAEDDVFVDEGDGDFDTSMPAPAKTEEKKTEPAAPVAQKAEPAPDMSVVEEELATPTIVEEKTDAPVPTNEDIFADEEPETKPVVKEDKPVKKAVEKKVATKKVVEKKVAKAAPKAKKVAKASKKGKGYFAWTADTCKLQRAPASTKSLGETAASKKIWVEDYDEKFVKVWNKAGEEAFLARECLK